jgi:FkbM family methyltransferase
MKLFRLIRERTHPLHALRKFKFYQEIPRYFDPIVPWRSSPFRQPICLRLLSHASLILDSNTQEESICEAFRAIVSTFPAEPGVFWDIGANIGWYTWECAALRPDFAIVSFEPDLKNLECLRRTSRRWNLPHHTIVSSAVAEHSGHAIFRPDDVTGATGTLDDADRAFTTTHYERIPRLIEIETISLDEFAREHAAPSIIKMDIEGTELSALKGASDLIGRFQPILFLETYSQRQEIVRYLERFGYRLYDSDRRQEIDDTTINVVAFAPDRFPAMAKLLSELGYPADRQYESARK